MASSDIRMTASELHRLAEKRADLIITISLKQDRRYRLRLWFAKRLMCLAARLLWCNPRLIQDDMP